MIVCAVLFVTVLFANFAESVAEGRGKAQAASLKKTQKDTQARLLLEDGTEKTVLSSELKKGDVVMVKACLLYTSSKGSCCPRNGHLQFGSLSDHWRTGTDNDSHTAWIPLDRFHFF